MSQNSSEEEQIVALKAFWEDYGNFILTAVLAASMAFAGWRYWQVHQRQHHEEMSLHFQQVMMDYQRAQGKTDPGLNTALQADAQKLIAMDPQCAYADMTRWVLARVAVGHGDLQEATRQLQAVLAHKTEAQMAALTHLRLAQVDIAAGKAPEAIVQLKAVTDKAYQASRLELEGDAWMAEHKPDQAKTAYTQARDAMESAQLPQRPLLNMKMADLGVKPVDPPVATAPGVPAS